jgi:hypothetical protein
MILRKIRTMIWTNRDVAVVRERCLENSEKKVEAVAAYSMESRQSIITQCSISSSNRTIDQLTVQQVPWRLRYNAYDQA